jgi:hypothetical protein
MSYPFGTHKIPPRVMTKWKRRSSATCCDSCDQWEERLRICSEVPQLIPIYLRLILRRALDASWTAACITLLHSDWKPPICFPSRNTITLTSTADSLTMSFSNIVPVTASVLSWDDRIRQSAQHSHSYDWKQ